ncbi:unnamed protein product [Spirodela intermedia]|uniref:non-specific serine/threonine protein kinase n=1 Tax=Spirodela intermedia TaxID=51605 RepID=A0A7I8JQ32_SPIIN|nr:unnamed protein product [Spirodela intermedia]CAA6671861.1 unnamed protein product [Spirodela intermedia]
MKTGSPAGQEASGQEKRDHHTLFFLIYLFSSYPRSSFVSASWKSPSDPFPGQKTSRSDRKGGEDVIRRAGVRCNEEQTRSRNGGQVLQSEKEDGGPHHYEHTHHENPRLSEPCWPSEPSRPRRLALHAGAGDDARQGSGGGGEAAHGRRQEVGGDKGDERERVAAGTKQLPVAEEARLWDIGSVYLVELRGTGGAFFAMKVMDKASLASRNKLIRAKTEREILGLLDHPFLPTLYSHFETDKFYCLVMEYCCGGNLHSLRQRQPSKHFSEKAARFYASEVLLALEYLHMLGIIYRDLKPENVLVREEGHIMLSDFDLSLRCIVSPTLVRSGSLFPDGESHHPLQGCIHPSVLFPRLLPKKNRKSKSDFGLGGASGTLPELMAEPTGARSMSFVGTHEYLAPEIIRGEGHGSAVDWWTLGIFLYELLHGVTPFKGSGNRATLFNSPPVSAAARDLIKGLLVKDPQKRIACRRGATEIKQHPFFEGVNWALVRSALPPHVPEPVDLTQFVSKEPPPPPLPEKKGLYGSGGGGEKSSGGGGGDKSDASDLDFEYF